MQAQARLDGFRIALRSQLTGLRAVILDRREGADRYRASAVNSADQIERIAQVSYDAGERGILELLDAYRTAASARVRQVALDAAVREAEIELEFASGWEMP
jgi:cobalt-zinc-cadmium efflux system outer membrane protein